MEKLTLTTIERDRVDIDGKEYQLKTADEFSFAYCMELSAIGSAIKEMDYNKASDRKKFTRYMNRIIKDILIAPKKIKKKLNDQNKVAIINFFLAQKKVRDQKKNIG